MPPLCGPLQKDEHLFIYFYLITFTTTETGCVGGRTTERGSKLSAPFYPPNHDIAQTNIDKLEMAQRRAARFAMDRYMMIHLVSVICCSNLDGCHFRREEWCYRCVCFTRFKRVWWTWAHKNLCSQRLDLPETLILVAKKSPLLVLQTIKCRFSRGRFAIGINYYILLCWPQAREGGPI